MNKSTVMILGGAGVATLLLGLGIGRYLIPAGEGREPAASEMAAAVTKGIDAAEAASTWTCSMHPQIQLPKRGKCPICGMDLIPIVEDGAGKTGPRTLSMSESSRALADIETTPVKRAFPITVVRLVGKLDYDETRVKSLSARFPARIDRLYVNYTGVAVRPGEHLARIYSPELLGAQRELLTAYRGDPGGSITRAAREKLRLWDLQPDQIEALLERGKASDQFELRAPVGGVVVSKNIKEGDYVKTGEPLFRIVDLGELWLHLEAYESDLVWLRYGQDVEFSVEAFPGESFRGRIAFIAPEVDRQTRTIAIRVNVSNKDGRLKPGMFARGRAEVRLADAGRVFAPELAGKWISPMHPEIVKDGPGKCDICGMDLVPAGELGYVDRAIENEPIVVPASAVLRTGRRAVVYVEDRQAGRPTFEGREVVLGPRAGDAFIVTSGLELGDRVVTQGAFKIDSALQIQARPSMMNREGGGPAPEHNHGGVTSARAAAASSADHAMATSIEITGEQFAKLIDPYLALQAALAKDDLAGAKAAARTMTEAAGHTGALSGLLHEILASDTLDELRRSHFHRLSQGLILAAKRRPDALGKEGLWIMHCPMAMNGAGADWLQASASVRNPYFGAAMPACGVIKETIAAAAAEHDGHARR